MLNGGGQGSSVATGLCCRTGDRWQQAGRKTERCDDLRPDKTYQSIEERLRDGSGGYSKGVFVRDDADGRCSRFGDTLYFWHQENDDSIQSGKFRWSGVWVGQLSFSDQPLSTNQSRRLGQGPPVRLARRLI